MDIRTANPSDSTTLSALCMTVWFDTYCIDGIEHPHAQYVLAEYTPEKLTHRIENTTVYLAEDKGRLLATAILNKETGEIETLYVLPRFKGRGIGSALLTALRDAHAAPLFLTCWEGNSEAIVFYDKKGFTRSGEAFFELDGVRHRNIEFTLY